MSDQHCLRKLEFNERISPKVIIVQAKALANNNSLRKLKFTFHCYSNERANRAITKMITQNTLLQYLRLSSGVINYNNGSKFTKA